MCALFVGDVQWLLEACARDGWMQHLELKCLSGEERDLDVSVSSSAVVVMMTDKISHDVRRRVLGVASAKRVPVCMRHSSGASGMGACLRRMAPGRWGM